MPPYRGRRQNISATAPTHLAASAPVRMTPTAPAHIAATAPVLDISKRTFQDLAISPKSRAAIQHEYMTEVQAMTIDAALKGDNLLVQARTGTGKTLAFLLPAIERIAGAAGQRGISVLILSPTRELAQQIEAEALPIAQSHGMSIVCAYGGANKNTQLSKIKKGCDILVATPGRLHDLLANDGLHQSMTNLKCYILDEVDRLLDAGFQADLAKIDKFLPNVKQKPRQHLFFSATIDNNVTKFMETHLPGNYKFLKAVAEDEKLTHERVSQTHIITPFVKHLPTLLHLLKEDRDAFGAKSKVIVFFPTARQVDVSAATLNALSPSMNVKQIHSRLSQAARSKISDQFRVAEGGVLLSSDVAARGVDFPGVTLVVQIGLPANGEQYIHRLGRTARAGAEGRGVIVLAPAEQAFLRDRSLVGIDIPDAGVPTFKVDYDAQVAAALRNVSDKTKSQAYAAWLGYYKSSSKITKWSPETLVQQANAWVSQCLGWTDEKPPGLEASTIGKMGLKMVPGLNKVKKIEMAGGSQRGGPSRGAPTPVAR